MAFIRDTVKHITEGLLQIGHTVGGIIMAVTSPGRLFQQRLSGRTFLERKAYSVSHHPLKLFRIRQYIVMRHIAGQRRQIADFFAIITYESIRKVISLVIRLI
ncbi:hypothetical protein, partial [Shewanella sp.]|uniref:hypothetical protein n=1 Tax=Shewanella sp. TaxID=50422 RepID=UPI000EEDBC53